MARWWNIVARFADEESFLRSGTGVIRVSRIGVGEPNPDNPPAAAGFAGSFDFAGSRAGFVVRA